MSDDFGGEFPFTTPEGSDVSMFIQWKGTDVCLDLICHCGHNGHVDGYFAYHVQCPKCGAVYQMGTQVIAKHLSTDEALALGGKPVMLD